MSDNQRTATIRQSDPKARARALQSLLIEKGLISTDALDEIISTYERDVGPMNGSRVVARAWTDPAFKRRLLEDGTAAVEELGYGGMEAAELEVVENTATDHNVVVCTLCSCYPWALLGLPPTWYKTPEYRSRIVKEPRAVLSEDFGVALDEDISVHVWDSTSEIRYMVLPNRPAGTDDMTVDELAGIVSRDAMIGVARIDGRED